MYLAYRGFLILSKNLHRASITLKEQYNENLNQERVKELFDYDFSTGLLTRKLKSGKRRLCGHKPISEGYGKVKIDGKMYLTHRVIWLWVFGLWPSEIDHIDRDRMNNRINNLREVCHQENQHNASLRQDNSSGFRGVSWHKVTGKYQVVISKACKQIHIGLFSSFDEAVFASKMAKIKYHPSSPIAKEYLRELCL